MAGVSDGPTGHRRNYGRRFLGGVISRAYHTGAAKEPFQQPSEPMAIACDLISYSVIALALFIRADAPGLTASSRSFRLFDRFTLNLFGCLGLLSQFLNFRSALEELLSQFGCLFRSLFDLLGELENKG